VFTNALLRTFLLKIPEGNVMNKYRRMSWNEQLKVLESFNKINYAQVELVTLIRKIRDTYGLDLSQAVDMAKLLIFVGVKRGD
jgi:hypothetical protein